MLVTTSGNGRDKGTNSPLPHNPLHSVPIILKIQKTYLGLQLLHEAIQENLAVHDLEEVIVCKEALRCCRLHKLLQDDSHHELEQDKPSDSREAREVERSHSLLAIPPAGVPDVRAPLGRLHMQDLD